MEKELECTKIKDGLYIANFKTAQDAEFLVTNKFTHIVNCSSEVANFYQGQGIKYIKFKLIRDKPHKLWDESLKKLKKLEKFIETCEENSMCCLIHSFDGVNRSLVMLVAFLMSRYRWKLGKTLEFIRSKNIFIGLSEHYIEQLEKLEEILTLNEPNLTEEWLIEYKSEEEEIVSKTFINSQEIELQNVPIREKKEKRVVWLDLIEKDKKKEQKEQLKEKEMKLSFEEKNILYLKPAASKSVGSSLNSNNNGIKFEKTDLIKKKKTKSEDVKESRKDIGGIKKLKINANKSKPEIMIQEEAASKAKISLNHKSIEYPDEELNSEDILNLLKKNLKTKKRVDVEGKETNSENEEKIYNVTINNFIKPNINILNKVVAENKKKTKKRPQSAWKKLAV